MSKSKIIEPDNVLLWIKESLIDYFKHKPEQKKIDIRLKKTISEILKPFEWDKWEWLLFIVTMEIEFKVEIPDKWADCLDYTLGEFLANLMLLEIKSDRSWTLQKVHQLGDICLEIHRINQMKTNQN